MFKRLIRDLGDDQKYIALKLLVVAGCWILAGSIEVI